LFLSLILPTLSLAALEGEEGEKYLHTLYLKAQLRAPYTPSEPT